MNRLIQYSKGILLACFALFILQSCSLVRQLAGTDYDKDDFAWNRRAKASEQKYNAAKILYDRLNNKSSVEDADITLLISPEGIDKILRQYENSTGWLDENTSYKIIKTSGVLSMGSADAKLTIEAYNSSYDVNLDLIMNCNMSFAHKNGRILIKIEPYDIKPYVKPGGIVSSIGDELISDLVRLNLGNVGSQFPDLQVPVDFTNSFLIDKSDIIVRDKLNLGLAFPQRKIDYSLKLKEILLFESGVFIAMNVQQMEISK